MKTRFVTNNRIPHIAPFNIQCYIILGYNKIQQHNNTEDEEHLIYHIPYTKQIVSHDNIIGKKQLKLNKQLINFSKTIEPGFKYQFTGNVIHAYKNIWEAITTTEYLNILHPQSIYHTYKCIITPGTLYYKGCIPFDMDGYLPNKLKIIQQL